MNDIGCWRSWIMARGRVLFWRTLRHREDPVPGISAVGRWILVGQFLVATDKSATGGTVGYLRIRSRDAKQKYPRLSVAMALRQPLNRSRVRQHRAQRVDTTAVCSAGRRHFGGLQRGCATFFISRGGTKTRDSSTQQKYLVGC